METTRIQNGQTEQIRVTALDIVSSFVTGLTDVLLEIRRESDGFYFDFNDSTFKNSGWTTRQNQMGELNITNSPGTYFYDFDTTALSDDNYFLRVTSATAHNTPWEGELKVGDYVDNLDATISSRASEANATSNTSSIISEVDANEVKIDLVQSDLTQVLSDITGLNNVSIADVQTALTNQGYTVVRAGKLDNLDATVSSRSSHSASDVTTDMDANSIDLNQILADIASLNNVSIADVQTALTNQGYTVVRAGKLDNLDGTVSSRASESNATSNKNEVIAEVDANETKIDLIATDLTAHRAAVETKIIKILGLTQNNFRFTDQIYDSNGSMTSGTITIYPTAADTTNQTNAFTSYSIVAVFSASDLLTDYKVTEN